MFSYNGLLSSSVSLSFLKYIMALCSVLNLTLWMLQFNPLSVFSVIFSLFLKRLSCFIFLDFDGQVPKGHVWIQGDNIYASNDSRYFGPVPYGLIQGKAFFRVLLFFG